MAGPDVERIDGNTLRADRRPSSGDNHDPGTRWVYNGTVYQTPGQGVWGVVGKSAPIADTDFDVQSAAFRVTATGATGATVTVTGYEADGTSHALGGFSFVDDGQSSGYYGDEYDHYRWSSTASDTTVEVR